MNNFFHRDRIAGLVIYPVGDAIAQLIVGEFHLLRLIVLAVAGGAIYAWEIPKWFQYIEKRYTHFFTRTLAAIVYFNPLWIARHLFFITIATAPEVLGTLNTTTDAAVHCIITGTKSFLGAIVLSFIGNFIIQNRLPLRFRFIGSSVFSGLMAVYYALSQRYF
ncbi:hypothetical protein K1X84_09670 [bacterium]|nr:hypothetical protein [bacterium]